MTTFTLKWIAIVAMAIDHVAATLVTNHIWYIIMRSIGRIAFPIFAFLLVEGYQHTRNVKRYIIRMSIFALVSEIPFDLCFKHTLLEWQYQNVFFTLSLGLLLLYLLDQIELLSMPVQKKSIIKYLMMILAFVIATLGRFDYTAAGILTVLLFYFFKEQRLAQLAGLIVINVMMAQSRIQMFAVAAIVVIACYNGEKGRSMKYFFYLFYPLHLLMLFFLQIYL